jgi:cytochrome b involved in lipid metabolism
MKREEFEQQVFTEKKSYVILDNLVIDIEKFQDKHPGGKFVINHNIGRDISKFFYGGYSLEGNLGRKP